MLKKLGYPLLSRNWRCKLGEIDLVHKGTDKTIIFVEVKTLVGPSLGFSPEDHLTFSKQRKLRQLALAYIASHHLEGVAYQIDLVAVELTAYLKVRAIRHYPSVIGG